MDKENRPPGQEALEKFAAKFFNASDEEIEAMLEGSKWQLYKRLDTGEIISLREYRERGLSAIPQNQAGTPSDNPCTQGTENSHHIHSERGFSSHYPK